MSIGVNATNVGWTDSILDQHRDMTETAVRQPAYCISAFILLPNHLYQLVFG